MPNKNKRNQRNPFFYFMKEQQEILSRKGVKVSIKEMPSHAHPLWKQMSLAEKQKYEEMAKSYRIEYNAVGRLASDGTSVRENMEEEERKEELEKQMRQGIVDLLRVPGGSKEDFIAANSRKKFYFVTFNVMCYVEGGTYIPNELGAAEYSIKDGLQDSLHKFIYPGAIPKGYTGEAMRHSDSTHLIPIEGHIDSERDYQKIWKEFMNFINPRSGKSDVPPPVFCLKESIYQTLGSLEWLAIQAGKQEEFQDLKVWDASYLLMELRVGAESAAASYAVAVDNLKKNNFDYIPNTRCYFHEDLDNANCALGYANRLCYLLSDAICGVFGVEVTERHLPLRAMADKPYEVHIPTFKDLTVSPTNERGIGRGLPTWSNQSSRPGSSVRDGMYSSLSERTGSRLHERIEPNSYTGISSSYSHDEPKASADSSDSDSENSPPGRSAESVLRLPGTSGTSSTVQLRQPVSMSVALNLARAAQAPAIVPGKGIGRGQRKLP